MSISKRGQSGEGWTGFYDEPRYSSGYATLFHTIAFMPETHMLKPFKDRVLSTYALMQAMIAQSSICGGVLKKRAQDIAADRDSSPAGAGLEGGQVEVGFDRLSRVMRRG
jgi:hypothetical protein